MGQLGQRAQPEPRDWPGPREPLAQLGLPGWALRGSRGLLAQWALQGQQEQLGWQDQLGQWAR